MIEILGSLRVLKFLVKVFSKGNQWGDEREWVIFQNEFISFYEQLYDILLFFVDFILRSCVFGNWKILRDKVKGSLWIKFFLCQLLFIFCYWLINLLFKLID